MEQGVTSTMAELFTKSGEVVTQLLEMVTDVITWGLGNDIVVIGFAAGLVGLGIGLFGAIRNAI